MIQLPTPPAAFGGAPARKGSQTTRTQETGGGRSSDSQLSQSRKPQKDATQRPGIPLRWVLILTLATAIGLVVGYFGGLPSGVGAGIAAAVALHKLVD